MFDIHFIQGNWVLVEAKEQEGPLVDMWLQSWGCESHSDSQKENLGDETDYAADQEDPLCVVAYDAGDPDRAEGSQGDEVYGRFFGGILAKILAQVTICHRNTVLWILFKSVLDPIFCFDKGWEDEQAEKAGGENEEANIGTDLSFGLKFRYDL